MGTLACGGEGRGAAASGGSGQDSPTEPAGDDGEAANAGRDAGRAARPGAAASCGAAALPVYADGATVTSVCPDDAAAEGLTVLDLRPEWTPRVFTEDASLGPVGVQPYRATLLALADENFEALPEDVEPERFLELFGIFPTLRVVHQRLLETERHACRAGVSDTNLGVLDELLRPWGDRGQKEARVRRVEWQRHRLEQARERLGLATIHELMTDERYGAEYRRYEHERVPVDAVRELVEHLRCDGLLPERFTDGVFDGHLVDALIVFQRRHMVTNAGFVDTPTREAFLQDSREADFATLLRVLRERVVDATGLIEDGSAAHAWGTVMGHKLDTAEFQMDAGHDAAPNAAPDLISPATEAAAQALGWTDAEAATRALGQLLTHGHAQVAVRLPPLPEYHGGEMALRAEIHRGDVYYDYPYTNTGAQIHQPTAQRPVFTLYVTHEGQEIALARWATTIGGWKTERTPGGGVGMSYKESPVGQRIMRDIIASPAWLPPPSTPNEDMVRRVPGVGYRANNALFGPSYRSAYGMVMLMHHRVMPTRAEGDPPRIHDEGIRTHGSVSYRSIVRGTSHGCHRLYNHLAVRLASFVLAHRPHQRHGSITVRYAKRFNYLGSYINFRIDSRGYRYELTPPMRVDVLEGTIRGARRAPVDGVRRLAGSAAASAVADTAD
ncbi:MAG: L,D-transpeptidase family protein [Sandaracinaceae bacterium]|nr:L,D-transpeptidase family protein [Sandaracinaceae bacterium]MBK8407870.1 L,D-transpeptidase family protein [Sandaracinaceae bacterium]MBK8588350.1 L,D-transpeptidase family protein [Sandaracinaceae bacterium]